MIRKSAQRFSEKIMLKTITESAMTSRLTQQISTAGDEDASESSWKWQEAKP
jgi:hypothetical protein